MRIILIGGDKTVYYLARQLLKKHHRVTIVNRDPHTSQELSRTTQATVVQGDGSNLATLEEAGARRADVLLALTHQDQVNLAACQFAHKIFGIPRTIALVNDPDNEEVFAKLGVTTSFSATRIIASLIEQSTEFEDITKLMSLSEGRLAIADVRLDRDSPAVGKRVAELKISTGTLIACIIRGGEAYVPSGSSTLQVDDHLLVISHPENADEDMALLTGER